MARFRRSTRARNNKNKKVADINIKNVVIVLTIIVIICSIILIIKNIQTQKEIARIEKERQDAINQILFTEAVQQEEKQEQEEIEVIKEDTVIKITTVGDILCETAIYEDAYNSETKLYNFSHMFEQIKKYTSNSDLTLGLLETNFVDAAFSGSGKYNAPIELAQELKNIGIDVLNTANNHSLDYGYKGVENTLNTLNRIGIDTVGTYKNEDSKKALIKDVKGIKLGFLSYTYGLNSEDSTNCVNLINKEKIKTDIVDAKQDGAEYVFVHMHWGDVNSSKQNNEQIELANYLFDNGADFILGSHPASLQPMEVRTNQLGKNIFIAYSTGNFISSSHYQNSNIEMILDIEITKSGETGETRLTKVTYTPVYLQDNGTKAENRFVLIDIGRAITNYENGNSEGISKKLYEQLKQARLKIDELIGKE